MLLQSYHIAQVVRTVLEMSYKCLFNAIARQTHDLTVNKLLLEKHAWMENMLERLRGEDTPDDLLADVSFFHFRTVIR